MRPGVIINVSRFSEAHPLNEVVERVQGRESPLERLDYCIDELDKEIIALTNKAPCESILSARTEIANLKSLVKQLECEHQQRVAEFEGGVREKPGGYAKVIQELMEEREKLEREIEELGRKEREVRDRRAVAPASGNRWEREFEE